MEKVRNNIGNKSKTDYRQNGSMGIVFNVMSL